MQVALGEGDEEGDDEEEEEGGAAVVEIEEERELSAELPPESDETEFDWWTKYYYSLKKEEADIGSEEEEALEEEEKVAELEAKRDEEDPIHDLEELKRRSSLRSSKRSSRSRKAPSSTLSSRASSTSSLAQSKASLTPASSMASIAESEGKRKKKFGALFKDKLRKRGGGGDGDSLAESLAEDKIQHSFVKCFDKPLEDASDFRNFDDTLRDFDIRSGVVDLDDSDDENDEMTVVGVFKGNFTMYKIPPWLMQVAGEEVWKTQKAKLGPLVLDMGRGMPSNEITQVKVIVYVLKCNQLFPTDSDGKANPFPVVSIGGQEDKSMKENYVPKNINPIFGKCYVFECKFPHESELKVRESMSCFFFFFPFSSFPFSFILLIMFLF